MKKIKKLLLGLLLAFTAESYLTALGDADLGSDFEEITPDEVQNAENAETERMQDVIDANDRAAQSQVPRIKAAKKAEAETANAQKTTSVSLKEHFNRLTTKVSNWFSDMFGSGRASKNALDAHANFSSTLGADGKPISKQEDQTVFDQSTADSFRKLNTDHQEDQLNDWLQTTQARYENARRSVEDNKQNLQKQIKTLRENVIDQIAGLRAKNEELNQQNQALEAQIPQDADETSATIKLKRQTIEANKKQMETNEQLINAQIDTLKTRIQEIQNDYVDTSNQNIKIFNNKINSFVSKMNNVLSPDGKTVVYDPATQTFKIKTSSPATEQPTLSTESFEDLGNQAVSPLYEEPTVTVRAGETAPEPQQSSKPFDKQFVIRMLSKKFETNPARFDDIATPSNTNAIVNKINQMTGNGFDAYPEDVQEALIQKVQNIISERIEKERQDLLSRFTKETLKNPESEPTQKPSSAKSLTTATENTSAQAQNIAKISTALSTADPSLISAYKEYVKPEMLTNINSADNISAIVTALKPNFQAAFEGSDPEDIAAQAAIVRAAQEIINSR